MRRNTDNIEIQEPPIEEIKKKKSCLKRSCTSSMGCLFIFLLVFIFVVQFAVKPKVKNLKEVPNDFPIQIPVYDEDSIISISYVSGVQRGKTLELLGYIPKFILSPIVMALDLDIPGQENVVQKTTWQEFYALMKSPVTDHRDITTIEWQELQANPNFIADYYKTELKNKKFEISSERKTKNIRVFSFSSQKISGSLYIQDNPEERGTDFATLTVYYPTKQKN